MAKAKAKPEENLPVKVAPKKAPAKVGDKLDLAAIAKANAKAGLEGTDRDSFAIPFLRVIQKGSPQVEEGNAEFIKEARVGMLFNSVTKKLYDGKKGVIFLPCAYERRFVHWGARDGGGGFKGEYLPEEADAMVKDGKLHLVENKLYFSAKPNVKKDDVVMDTRNHYGIVITDDGPEQVLFPLASTQIKKSKQLMGLLSSVRIGGECPPTWVNKIRVTTAMEKNESGSWMGVSFVQEGFIDSRKLYDLGAAFYETVVSGAQKVDYSGAAPEAPAAEEGDDWGDES